MRIEFPHRLSLLLPGAFVAGGLHVLAFAPFNAWFLQLALLALLFAALLRCSGPRDAGLVGWMFGSGWYVVGVSWLFISMHRYGGMPAWLAALAVLLLALFMGSFLGLAMAGAAWLRRRRALPDAFMLLLVLPAMLTLADWTRIWAFTGFPWIITGYAHTDSPLAGFAPLTGVLGLGWLAAVIAGSLVLARRSRAVLVVPVLLLAAGAGLKPLAWTTPTGQPLSVRLLQTNVPQNLKFERETVLANMETLQAMVAEAPADLVVTPETAVPVPTNFLPADYLPRFAAWAKASGSHVVVGAPAGDDAGHYANSALAWNPAGAAYRYDKHHLVPFGEFVPWGFRWFVDAMRIPLGDFGRADVMQPPLAVGGQRVQPNICYEDLFGEEIAAQLRGSDAPATMLLNLSNIAWFGDSIALPQHLQVSRMRAMETGRPMLRSTNTGMTAVIRPDGSVQAALAPGTRGTLAASVQGYAGLTPYVRIGNAFPVGLCFLALGLAVFLRRSGGLRPAA